MLTLIAIAAACILYTFIGAVLVAAVLILANENAEADEIFAGIMAWPFVLYQTLRGPAGRLIGTVRNWYRSLKNK